MGWLRAHRRAGIAVACFAMMLQLVTLFGHTHVRDGAGARHAVKAYSASSANDIHAASDRAALPAPDDDALCAVCLLGHLAGVAITPTAPVLFAPVAHSPRAPPAIDLVYVAAFERPFWSQGPPAV